MPSSRDTFQDGPRDTSQGTPRGASEETSAERPPGRPPLASLRPEQRAWTATLRTLAARRLRPLVEAAEPGRVNRPLVAALGEHGLLARVFPPDGVVRAVDLCLLREALGQECTEAETALALQGLGAHPIAEAGTEKQRARWLPEVVAGRAVAAFALSEPEAGSDAAALRLRAEPASGSGWTLHGEKQWISNAPEADFYTVFARTRPDAGAHGVTAFLVPADRPGLGGRPLRMIAPHPVGLLTFDGVPVGPDDVLGEVDGGFGVALRTLDLFRPSVGAFAVGMSRAALRVALTHAAERRAFGGPLKDLQAVSHQLADMATRTEAAALLVHAAATAYDAGEPGVAGRSAMAKLYATETAQYVVDAALQIHGARGLEQGHLLEHLYREVRATRIYEGATEVQRTIIARELYR
ncbi:acyl-CoA dehydrogenase family protein [Streptomyces mobaraensis NBRC 13819 = DSM 40847]|uniref:Putative acyl-CoA dehydrogenase n=1 Tax=Streptomyces mobaraensis (strain ATCC 29032 / DSM 40847 / JCM 4168 / NBRC 13819 / NCIMB 11159 / IPCR 16-22) TaxID=1223523 RepID=M3BHQ2_STRM1|nr:acyl-CoA dehydrogenase family protein [Streptomyces mobaraensis]EME99119.1 putative acyl-CoA dehydrogenase [Streptomyces mobaraensis NBRC 13819 = DSM 40847]QTT76172.1 acyl-CoA dehydrogenase family protein [Streptomyces mobaraensis NBRC 13819 = DSM 40847]